MTTTPTERLDLDRLEALARAATPGPWVYQEDSDAYTHIVRPAQSPGRIVRHYEQDTSGVVEANARFTAGANPAAVLALIAAARRAQPEGEAPQAAALANQPAPTVPAAAFTPTDAQFIEWCTRHDLPPEHNRDAFEDAASLYLDAHQPAQEQAEPVAAGYISDDAAGMLRAGRPITMAVSIAPHPVFGVVPIYFTAQQEPVAAPDRMTERKRGELEQRGYSVVGYVMQDARYERCTVAHGKVDWEPVAAPQQAAAPRTELSKRIREAATADVTMAQAKLLIGAAEEIERAQQAAAPGAQLVIGVAAPQGATISIMQPHADGTTTVIYGGTHPAGDSMGRAVVAPAPIAPGAPEAPGELMRLHVDAQALADDLRRHHEMDIWDWDDLLVAANMLDRVNAALFAAQLDGGQEEGKAHG